MKRIACVITIATVLVGCNVEGDSTNSLGTVVDNAFTLHFQNGDTLNGTLAQDTMLIKHELTHALIGNSEPTSSLEVAVESEEFVDSPSKFKSTVKSAVAETTNTNVRFQLPPFVCGDDGFYEGLFGHYTEVNGGFIHDVTFLLACNGYIVSITSIHAVSDPAIEFPAMSTSSSEGNGTKRSKSDI